MVDAHDVDHVLSVAGQVLHGLLGRVVVHEDVEGVQADHTVQVADGPELVVRQVAGHVAHHAAVGVGGHDGLFRQLHDVPEACVI